MAEEATLVALRELVTKYAQNRSEYLKPSYNETALRIEFLNPLFTLLGWDVDNERGLSIYAREVIHESTVVVDDEDPAHATKKPDYAFRVGGETQFFLEAKKPSVNISENRSPAFQARRYGWNGNHPIVVLSNFEHLSIYDCGFRPRPEDSAAFARIAHLRYDELEDNFDYLISLISKDAVQAGSLQEFRPSESTQHEPFDAFFLSQIRDWRAALARDIAQNNTVKDGNALDLFTQALIDRIVFLRVCEDRGFASYTTLSEVKTYRQLEDLFEAADAIYDSGLFQDLEANNLVVSDEVVASIVEQLYYPVSPYSFNVVPPHVIGQIYEQFLAEHILLDGDMVIFAKTIDAADSDGVVPTPKEITDAIVANTLQDLSYPCKVADICCGSGNFLLSVYEYLISRDLDGQIEHTSHYFIELIDRASGPDLPFWRKREILIKAIYGVDINPLAAEVAKLNLVLKLLEDCTKEELDEYREETGNTLLPDLSGNIKCGNSLVGYSYYDFDPEATSSIKTLRNIRPFEWANEFDFEGFDAIVGNPPYIRVQNLARLTPKEYDFYKSPYCDLTLASTSALDKYQLFIERALGLLNSAGRLGVIVPNKFMTIQTGKKLRRLLSGKYHISRIVDFGAIQVFPNRSTYTCIIVASPEAYAEFSRIRITDLTEFLLSPCDGFRSYPETMLTAEPWAFQPEAIEDHLSKIAAKCSPLSSLAKVFVGLQTSNDGAYIIKPERVENGLVYFKDYLGYDSIVEESICHPCLLDVVLEPLGEIRANRLIIFPYSFESGSAKLIPLSQIAKEYPKAFEYLSHLEPLLKQRAFSPRLQGGDWHRFGRSQSINRFSGKEHLIWSVLSLGPKYSLDTTGSVMFTGGGNGPYYGLEMLDDAPESIEYVQAVLCHWFVESIVRHRTSLFGGEYYSHGKQFIEDVPIRRIDFSDPEEVAAHERITCLVKQARSFIAKRDEAILPGDKELYSRSIEAAKNSLERLVDELYELDNQLKERTEG